MSELNPPVPLIVQHTAAAKKAINKIKELYTKMQVQEVLNYQNSPLITIIYNLLINSKVLIWRKGNAKKIGSWKGLFKLLKVLGEIYIL